MTNKKPLFKAVNQDFEHAVNPLKWHPCALLSQCNIACTECAVYIQIMKESKRQVKRYSNVFFLLQLSSSHAQSQVASLFMDK